MSWRCDDCTPFRHLSFHLILRTHKNVLAVIMHYFVLKSRRDCRERKQLFAQLALLAALASLPLAGCADGVGADATNVGESVFVETSVIGGGEDFVTVRHITISGSNFEIGRRLAELAKERYDASPATQTQPEVVEQQLNYFREQYPIHAERMRGVAAAFDKDLDDPSALFSTLGYGFIQAGCSVAYYPPKTTADGVGVLSRNFDFTTGTIEGKKPPEGEQAICAQPYIMELYPDEGYASLALVCYDLMGVVDGVNSEGLTVALLADDEVTSRFGSRATGWQAGLGVLQVGRMLLDTCANVEEAKAALRKHKLYYTSIPCHYIIADRHGNSFVWENNVEMTVGHVFEGAGKPQATTNFMRFLHEDVDNLPAETFAGGSFSRYRKICAGWSEHDGPLTMEAIKQINAGVAATVPRSNPDAVPGRTIWYSLYVPERQSLEVNFYLGEPDSADGQIRRSEDFSFRLRSESQRKEIEQSG